MTFLMLVMLLLTGAMMKFDFSQASSYPRNSKIAAYYTLYNLVLDNGYNNMPLESRNRYERDEDAERGRKLLQKLRQFVIPKKRLRKNVRKRCPDDETDVVDREDHITQLLSDMFVNTDSEITILQAAEPEEGTVPSDNEEAFFNFLISRQANELTR